MLKSNIASFNTFVDKQKINANDKQINDALYNIGANIAGYIMNQAPTPPIEYGMLRGSINIVVGNKSIEYNPNVSSSKSDSRKKKPRKNEVTMPNRQGNLLGVRVVMSMPYAEIMHEMLTPEGPYKLGEVSQQADSVGGGFIRKKMENQSNIRDIKEDLQALLGI